ncbi:MAG: SEC-C domain-containing protein [Candidatus Methanoperedens sp.]|nr:SEC-C domain-containing protein [Candidatus Methanoperedens sp.]
MKMSEELENIEELYSEYYTDQEIDEDEKWSFNPDILENEDDKEMEQLEPEDQRKTKKVGRNAPCPCGSGQKYKKCCMEK